MNQAAKHHIT
jgi:hypothetical protein